MQHIGKVIKHNDKANTFCFSFNYSKVKACGNNLRISDLGGKRNTGKVEKRKRKESSPIIGML